VLESIADLKKTGSFSAYFNKTLRHKTSQKLVKRKWRYFILTDGWTYRRKEGETEGRMENITKVVATSCNFAKVSKMENSREYKRHLVFFCGEGRNSIIYCRAPRLRALFLLLRVTD
jgi:hypothetical protein